MGGYKDDTGDFRSGSAEDAELCAMVSINGVVTTHVLPDQGVIDIGRGVDCDLVIEHPSVSRHHATLQISPLNITDMHSRNGTRVRGEVVQSGVSTPLEIGEAVQLGKVTILFHHRAIEEGDSRSPTERTITALLRQLEAECAKSARSGSPFALVRVQAERADVTDAELRSCLRPSDVIAAEGRHFQILLPDTTSEHVANLMSRIRRTLGHRADGVRMAAARYPYDGTTPAALIARVWEQIDAPIHALPTAMDALRALVAQIAASEVSVLIYGETGVGKELCAEMVHRQSLRANKPFVKLNCSAIAESLIESELFGHERGAFTGATATTPGLLEAGDGGTVFLDEVGELPLPAQAKLLRVLEDRIVRRVGSTAGRTLDVRFVCATNRDLPQEIEAGKFRSDLYYRINGVTLNIPPLRERVGEIAGLARAFSEAPRSSSPGRTTLSEEAILALEHYPWRGNIRELRNTLERAVVLAAGKPIQPEHLGLEAKLPERGSVPTMPIERITSTDLNEDASLAETIADLERRRIQDALERCGGNQTRAARMLGISRNTLLTRLATYGLPRPRKT